MELVGGWFVINEAYPVLFLEFKEAKLSCIKLLLFYYCPSQMVKAIHVLSANLGKSWNKQPQYDLSLEDLRTKTEYLADKQTNEQKDTLMNMQTDG